MLTKQVLLLAVSVRLCVCLGGHFTYVVCVHFVTLLRLARPHNPKTRRMHTIRGQSDWAKAAPNDPA